ncbi:MAG: PstS family phosphate ABC transporter substrate-binding protein [Armatimonadota bacterium]
MRYVIISLLLAGVLLQTPAWSAEALPQPDAQDWKKLTMTAQNTMGQYKNIVDDQNERVKRWKEDLGRSKSNTSELKLAIANAERVLERCNKAVTALKAIVTELQGMKEANRTRAKYLQLRRQTKEWQVQFQVDQRARYSESDGKPSMAEISFYEARLKALKANPPQTVPVGPRPKDLALDWQTLPRLDGSTTAQPLSTLVLCRILGLGAVWQHRPIYDRSDGQESPERILIPQCAGSPLPADAEGYPYDSGSTTFPGLRISLAMTGTNNAYRNLILGTNDFIIVARPPSVDETKLAKAKGVELESRVIAYDAFIFILNSANPVSNLTVKHIQDIFQDHVLYWSEVGGKKEKMIAYQRERNSGSQETMQELVMKDLTMAPPVEQLLGYGMGGPYNKLTNTPNGISYTFFYYHTVQSPVNRARIMRLGADKPEAPPQKICTVNGIMPTPDTIHNRTYPFVTEVYAIVRKDTAKDSPAVRLRDWLLTPEGQGLVKESGYVPLPEK